MELVNKNAVVTANRFNLSLVSQLWLVRNGVVGEDEWEGPGIFTPAFIQFGTSKYEVLLMEERLQLTLQSDTGTEGAAVRKVVGQIVRMLPHTPYTGVGLNFTWHLKVPDKIREVSRRLFFRDTGPLGSLFDCADARYGGYYSKDVLGMRLKLNGLPSILDRGEGKEELIQFAFNYHLDAATPEKVLEGLENWDAARSDAERIVEVLEANL